MDSDTLNQSIEHLSKDSKFKALIDKYNRPNFENNDNYFNALSKSIIYQQLSGKVAKVIYNRFLDLFKNRIPDLEVIINQCHFPNRCTFTLIKSVLMCNQVNIHRANQSL